MNVGGYLLGQAEKKYETDRRRDGQTNRHTDARADRHTNWQTYETKRL